MKTSFACDQQYKDISNNNPLFAAQQLQLSIFLFKTKVKQGKASHHKRESCLNHKCTIIERGGGGQFLKF